MKLGHSSDTGSTGGATAIAACPAGPSPPPERAGDYLITGTLGSGGCGTVYSAEHAQYGSLAAIKVLRRELAFDRRFSLRFEREVKAVNLIRHPSIIDIFDFGELADRRPYYAMELAEGRDLCAIIQQQGRIVPGDVEHILGPVCAAVGAAHGVGVVHRDLKSRNIMVARYETRIQVKLLDFGVAKLLEPESMEPGRSGAGILLGTPVAMSPEQIRGDPVTPSADIYALGVLVYQMLTGSFPFYGDGDPELFRMHLEAPPPRPSQSVPVASGYDDVVRKAMAKHPGDRYASPALLLAALHEVGAGSDAPLHLSNPQQDFVAVHLDISVSEHVPEGSEAKHGETNLRENRDEEANRDEGRDNALAEDLMTIQEMGDDALRAAGFLLPSFSSTSIVGLRALNEAGGALAACKTACVLATQIAQDLAAREDPDPRVTTQISVHLAAGQRTCGSSETSTFASEFTNRHDDAPSPAENAPIHVTRRVRAILRDAA
ncbi:MAG: serine/threonine-protein kinase [Nannocystaceae bacterium]